MKKYMIADLVKDIRSDSIAKYMKLYNISESEIEEVNSRAREYYADDLESIPLSIIEKPFQMVYIEKEYDTNSDESNHLVENWDTEAEWRDVMATAEGLDAGIEDIDDDDVENFMSMGGTGKGDQESSIGPIQWIYDNKLKAFIVYIALRDMKCGSGEVLYKLDKDQMKDWINSDSMGEYYNDNIRSQIEEDPRVSCGCCENLCEPQDIAAFKQKHSSIS